MVCDDLIEEFAEGGVVCAESYLLGRGGVAEREEDEYREEYIPDTGRQPAGTKP